MTREYHNCRLERIVDPDTLIVRIDLGFSTFAVQTIRLLGVNCPEKGKPRYEEALGFVSEWFWDHKTFTLRTTKTKAGDKREKYGRYLAVVVSEHVSDLHIPLNDLLLIRDLAVPMEY